MKKLNNDLEFKTEKQEFDPNANFQLYVGDSLEVLKYMESNSIDAVVTDPPYGLSKQPDMNTVLKRWMETGEYHHSNKGFMQKEWDAFVPSPNLWKEVFRVLKPGGHVLAFFGTRTYDLGVLAMRMAGFEIRDQIAWIYGTGFPKSRDIAKDIEEKFGKDDAKNWEGWGTSLKPAMEPIVMARKPLSESSVASNVVQYGAGAINVQGCCVQMPSSENNERLQGELFCTPTASAEIARKPANLIHDGSSEVVSLFPQTGGKGSQRQTSNSDQIQNSTARFFYSAKCSKKDRSEGLEGFEPKQYSHDGRAKVIENPFQRNNSVALNHHPTVKPTELMQYLVRMVTPESGVVLDPFMGSGSTGKAAMLEGKTFIGIELQEDYCEIAKARISHALAQIEKAA